jgi:anti-sigma B factor antagonist
MQITHTRHESILVLAIAGSIDSLNADELSAHLAESIDQGSARLVADFSHVNYTSSAGLRALLGSLKRCRLAGGDLRMAAVQPQVQRVLDIAGFSSILNIFPAVDEAVNSFGEAA